MAAERGEGSWASHPGMRPHATLFLEAFGQLSRHVETPNEFSAEVTLWAVFSARAEVMGWSSTPGKGSSPQIVGQRQRGVLWWVHEAELSADAASSRIGWAQVGLEVGVPLVSALPPMVQCLDDALRRFGVTEVSGLQLTASHLPPSNVGYTWDLPSWLTWFILSTGPETEALVTTDDGLFHGHSDPELFALLQRMGSGRFSFGPLVTPSREHMIDVPKWAPGGSAISPSERGFSVSLPEWSPSAAAWALAFIIETALVSAPYTTDFAVRLTRTRADGT